MAHQKHYTHHHVREPNAQVQCPHLRELESREVLQVSPHSPSTLKNVMGNVMHV